MDVLEIARRLWSRWPVIAALAVAGGLLGLLFHVGDETRYTATVRVLAEGDALTTPGAMADELRAVATTNSRVQAAIDDVGVDRSVDELVHAVRVEPLGQSSVLALSVSDADPDMAAAFANSLADQTIVTLGPANDTGDEDGDASDDTGPIILEQARVPDSPDASRWPADTALGLFLGLIAGVGTAAVLETMRPTLVAPRYVAEAFNTRLLGDVEPADSNPGGDGGMVPPMVTTTVGYAAENADVKTVWLVAVDPLVNIEPLAEELRAGLAHRSLAPVSGHARADDANPDDLDDLRVEVWAPHRDVFPDAGSKWSGLLIVAPPHLPLNQVSDLRQIIELVSQPVLGMITYRP